MAKAHMMGGGKGKGKGAAGRYAGLSTVGNMTANYNHHRREYAIMMRSKGGKGEGERRDEWQSQRGAEKTQDTQPTTAYNRPSAQPPALP